MPPITAPTSPDLDKVEHGIEGACYSNGPSGYLPMMDCICGFGTGYGNLTWAEAGAEFDEHLGAA